MLFDTACIAGAFPGLHILLVCLFFSLHFMQIQVVLCEVTKSLKKCLNIWKTACQVMEMGVLQEDCVQWNLTFTTE